MRTKIVNWCDGCGKIDNDLAYVHWSWEHRRAGPIVTNTDTTKGNDCEMVYCSKCLKDEQLRLKDAIVRQRELLEQYKRTCIAASFTSPDE